MPYWFQPETISFEIGGREMSIETGRIAKQAAGAALITYGGTVVLVTAVHSKPRALVTFIFLKQYQNHRHFGLCIKLMLYFDLYKKLQYNFLIVSYFHRDKI